MENSGFFNAQIINGEYDRVYLADAFAKYFAAFVGNGVYGGKGEELVTLAENVPGMAVQVRPGQAYINGYWYENVTSNILALDIADGVDPRIDSIVVRWGNVERKIWLAVKKGIASPSPQVPQLQRDHDYYELQLCSIQVNAGAIQITQSDIVDTRPYADICGFVHGLIQQFDATSFGLQLQSFIDDYITHANINMQDFLQWLQSQESDAEQQIRTLLEYLNSLADEAVIFQLEQRIGSLEMWREITNEALSLLTNRVTALEQTTIDTAAIKAIVLEAFYPIGSIYMSAASTNPGTTMGGIWVPWGSGRVPVGINTSDADFDVVEKTGGAKTHTNPQTIHAHAQTVHVHAQTIHAHTQTNHYHTLGSAFVMMNVQPAGLYYYNKAPVGWTANIIKSIGGNLTGSTLSHSDGVAIGGTTDGMTQNLNTGNSAAINTGNSAVMNTGNSAATDTGAGSSLQPYIVCYMWKRTA